MRILDSNAKPLPRSDAKTPEQEKEENLLAHAKASEATLRERMEEGDWVGGYECVALDSAYIGQRFLLVYDRRDFETLLLGTQAPDTKSFGPGWKFRLVKKFEDAYEAGCWLHRVGEPA